MRRAFAKLVLRFCADIAYVHHIATHDGASRSAPRPRLAGKLAMDDFRPPRNRVRDGCDVDQLAVERQYRALLGMAQPHSPLSDCLEYRLHVRGRTADDPEDLRRRRLLFEGFGRDTLQFRIRRRGLGTFGALEGRTARVAEFRARAILVLAPRTRHAGPPSGRVGGGSERWAETNRPRLAWSRTRSSGHLFS